MAEDRKSLSEYLNNLATVYNPKDIDWVRFVHDHYQIIFDSSTEEPIDAYNHYWQYYRLEDYLRDNHYDPNIAWIVLLINQMESRLQFKDLKSIRIPSPKTIQALWRSFMQYRVHVKNCRK